MKRLIKTVYEESIYNVTFDVEQDLVCNGNENASGCTVSLGTENHFIFIDRDYIIDPTTPTIFLAQTLIHESIHANLYAAVKNFNNGKVPEDLAWGGLQGTPAFNNKSTAVKNRILDVIRIELTGKDTNGNTKTKKGQNAGC